MYRLWRIQNELGFDAFARTCLLLLCLVLMALYDYLALGNITAPLIGVVGLILGSKLREEIARRAERYPRVIKAGLFVYPVVLLLGELTGFDGGTQLAILTGTTVILFDLQFWALSDPSVINAERNSGAE